MEKRSFGKTGYQVSPLGFGAAPIGYLQTEYERAASILNLLLDKGINVIDTAASYPGSEETIGKAIAHRRREFVLISKCGSKVSGVSGEAWSAPLIAQTVDRSLKNLNTDHLNVMLLHSCSLDILKKGEAIEALVQARQAGKIRFAGYSGDNDAAAYAAGHPEIAVIETSINIADQMNIDRVLPIARQNNLGVIAKRPIANAAWKNRDEQPGMYKDYAQTYHDRLKKMKLIPRELGFFGDQDHAWAEIALRFTLSQQGVHTAIVGTTSPDNAQANIAYATKRPLSNEAIDKLRQAFRAADPAGSWTGQS